MRDISRTDYFKAEMISTIQESSATTISETILYQVSGTYAQRTSVIKSVIHKKRW